MPPLNFAQSNLSLGAPLDVGVSAPSSLAAKLPFPALNLRSWVRKAKYVVLPRPSSGQFVQARHAHPMREAPIDSRLHQVRGQPNQRDRHVDLPLATPFARGDRGDARCGGCQNLSEPGARERLKQPATLCSRSEWGAALVTTLKREEGSRRRVGSTFCQGTSIRSPSRLRFEHGSRRLRTELTTTKLAPSQESRVHFVLGQRQQPLKVRVWCLAVRSASCGK